jgi:hypothetical protein
MHARAFRRLFSDSKNLPIIFVVLALVVAVFYGISISGFLARHTVDEIYGYWSNGKYIIYIHDDVVEVVNLFGQEYWAGEFVVPEDDFREYSWTSRYDLEKSQPYADGTSGSDIPDKDFIFKNGTLDMYDVGSTELFGTFRKMHEPDLDFEGQVSLCIMAGEIENTISTEIFSIDDTECLYSIKIYNPNPYLISAKLTLSWSDANDKIQKQERTAYLMPETMQVVAGNLMDAGAGEITDIKCNVKIGDAGIHQECNEIPYDISGVEVHVDGESGCVSDVQFNYTSDYVMTYTDSSSILRFVRRDEIPEQGLICAEYTGDFSIAFYKDGNIIGVGYATADELNNSQLSITEISPVYEYDSYEIFAG